MADEKEVIEVLKALREAGVKSVTFAGENVIASVEFFPRSLIDVAGLTAPAEEAGAAVAPAQEEDGPPNIPPAFQRVLGRRSVS